MRSLFTLIAVVGSEGLAGKFAQTKKSNTSVGCFVR
jgi:hypothetical protein